MPLLIKLIINIYVNIYSFNHFILIYGNSEFSCSVTFFVLIFLFA